MLIIFFFYIFKDNKVMTAVSFVTLVAIKYWPRLLNSNFNSIEICLTIGTLIPLIPILLYKGKQGKKAKYFFYIFYPAHLLLFWILTLII